MLPGQGTGFTSVSDYLDANAGTLAREGSDIGGAVGGQIDAARGAADQLIAGDQKSYQQDYTTLPGYQDALDKAIAAKDQTTALGDQGGLSDYFQKNLHDSRSQGDFDASLLGASGKLDTAGLAKRGGDLIGYLNQGLAGVPAPGPAQPSDRDPEQPASNGSPGDFPGPGRRGPAQPYPYTPVGTGPKPRGPGAPF